MSKLQPIGEYLMIQYFDEEKPKNGIIFVDDPKDLQAAYVISLGTGKHDRMNGFEFPVSLGDVVYTEKNVGRRIGDPKEKMFIVHVNHLIAVKFDK